MSNLDLDAAGRAFCRLVDIMHRLRGPDGCPWDREQTMRSLRRYTLEEAYEVVQAIDDRDYSGLPGELGDLLLQVVFLAEIASEEERFDVADVANAIADKLVRRHPHVFADTTVADSDEVVRNWEAIKQQERGPEVSVLDGVPRGLPALERGQKLGRRAAQIGFDWSTPRQVLDKLKEELVELEAAFADGTDPAAVEEEIGDLLFATASLARHLKLSAEVAATAATAKFERRFRLVEKGVEEGRIGSTVEEMETEWQRIKAQE